MKTGSCSSRMPEILHEQQADAGKVRHNISSVDAGSKSCCPNSRRKECAPILAFQLLTSCEAL